MSRQLLASIFLWSLVLAIRAWESSEEIISSCPDVRYLEGNTTSWSAAIVLRSEDELNGIWLRLVFDTPPVDVTSTFGEVVQREASEYLIRRPDYKLSDGIPTTFKIRVKYEGVAPHVISYRLNAKQICPEESSAESGTGVPSSYDFQYDPQGKAGEWSGTLVLNSDAELTGVYSRISFDKPPLEVETDFGEVVQRENTEYLIRKPGFELPVGKPLKIRLDVKYDPADGAAPQLSGVRLNAKQIFPLKPIVAPTPPPLVQGLNKHKGRKCS